MPSMPASTFLILILLAASRMFLITVGASSNESDIFLVQSLFRIAPNCHEPVHRFDNKVIGAALAQCLNRESNGDRTQHLRAMVREVVRDEHDRLLQRLQYVLSLVVMLSEMPNNAF